MKKFLPKPNPHGFTLVELLVVVAIISLLSLVGIVIFTNVQKNARDARRKADIQAISTALETHYNDTANQHCSAPEAVARTYCAPQASWFAVGAIPKDPGTNADYTGMPADGATIYNVCATLEAGGTTFCLTQQR